MPVDALAKNDGVRGRKGEERNAEMALKEGTRTYEPFHHHARAVPNKRRAPLMDLSKLTAEEQERWKKARARKYSASARQRRLDRVQDLKDQVEISSVFRVLVEAAPDAVLLLSPDERACILFANDQCGDLLRLDSLTPKGQALVGQSLWEWMDGKDKAIVVAAIGVCVFCKGTTRRVQCTLYSPRSPFAPQLQVAQQQEAVRTDITFRSSEMGLVVFMRPDKTGVKGM
jgi:PAS domain-containing protein